MRQIVYDLMSLGRNPRNYTPIKLIVSFWKRLLICERKCQCPCEFVDWNRCPAVTSMTQQEVERVSEQIKEALI